MLIENPFYLLAGCGLGAAAFNLAMMKVSPQIKDRTRHVVAGTVPVAASFALLIGPHDSVVAYGSDLATIGASLVAGLSAAYGSTRFVRPQRMLTRR
ncbi:hypothetical protein [Aurantiacibacter poecillastricola]|uniref:hypothetical protein n=1 Tax=Aurantiacibacter poecillastricola TaxID=3064385 RepID=UPI00273FD266|nr:hypothetical protein [Aurantiacibacter sp. 219JJ12-13]MDP5261769.1 hypothetical protein [Aurantiacibacter sp. 219JJ12-13]